MGEKLAIKGHSTRGKEVIELLEMLGGKNTAYHGGDINVIYTIDDKGFVRSLFFNDSVLMKMEYKIFTLEEFLEKYPFKVGDIADSTIDYESCFIDKMRWNSEKCWVEYHLIYLNGSEHGWHVSECLIKPENEDVTIGTKIESTGFMQMGKTVSVIFNSENYEDEVELQLGDYEIEVRDGKTYAVKKKAKYPTTYEKCCEKINACPIVSVSYDSDEDMLYNDEVDLTLLTLRKLLICRNAYWKIAGDEMGLDKPWDSTYGCGEWGYWVGYSINENKIYLQDSRILVNHTLVFPTEEMRDTFYENFKYMIEQCKELL